MAFPGKLAFLTGWSIFCGPEVQGHRAAYEVLQGNKTLLPRTVYRKHVPIPTFLLETFSFFPFHFGETAFAAEKESL